MNYAKRALSSIALAALLCGCASTVTPKPVTSAEASWDGGAQNSGIGSETTSHSFIVTPHFVDRYNGMIAVYGGRFNPPLRANDGISQVPNSPLSLTGSSDAAFRFHYEIDAEHMADFLRMNRWRKEGK